MKYLFFDIENATSKDRQYRICEFGYVQTYENYSLIKRDNLIIDPKIREDEWDKVVLGRVLTRKMSEYLGNKTLKDYYEQISKLISESDYVFGFDPAGDIASLNVDCNRYGLKAICCNVYDTKKLYEYAIGEKCNLGLAKIVEKENVKCDEKDHDAGTDALNTKELLKVILNKKAETLECVLSNCKDSKLINDEKRFEEDVRKKSKKERKEEKNYKSREVRGLSVGDLLKAQIDLNKIDIKD